MDELDVKIFYNDFHPLSETLIYHDDEFDISIKIRLTLNYMSVHIMFKLYKGCELVGSDEFIEGIVKKFNELKKELAKR